VVTAAGLPYAFTGGLLVIATDGTRITGIGAPHVLSGSTALALFGVIGYLGVGAVNRLFSAAVAAGLLGMLGGALGLTSLPSEGPAAITLTVGIALMPTYPLLSMRIGKLPFPVLPQRAEDMLKDDPVPKRSEVFAAVARADEVLTGLLTAVSLVSTVCAGLLVLHGSAGGVILAMLAAGALLLRGRLFPTPRQRIPLLVGGIIGAIVLFVAMTFRLSDGVALGIALMTSLVGGAVVMAAGLVYSRRPPSPYVGRAADIFDVLLLSSLVPVACISVGAYGYVRGLFASFGG
jgi:type VII secretion integral membrane protein EccD